MKKQEFKKNYRGPTVKEEVRIQINDLEHKEEKTTNQNNKKKKESRKMRTV